MSSTSAGAFAELAGRPSPREVNRRTLQGMEHIEVLGTSVREREPRSARSRRLIVVLAATAVVLAGGVWWFDQSQRDGESGNLAQCVSRGEQAARAVEARVDMMRTYIAPVLGQDLTDSTRNGLFVLVREEAVKGLPAVVKTDSDCRKIRISTWHGDLRSARVDYLSYLDARISVLHSVSIDGGLTLTGDEGVPALRETALTSLRTAGLTL